MTLGTPRYSPNRSFWGNSPRPTQLSYSADERNFSWAAPTTGIVHAFHGSHWGGWQFGVVGHDAKARTIHEGMDG